MSTYFYVFQFTIVEFVKHLCMVLAAAILSRVEIMTKLSIDLENATQLDGRIVRECFWGYLLGN